MARAVDWLKDNRFEYENVSATESCDFRAKRDGDGWVIEVKGTTCGPGSVLLTRNEVALHKANYPRNVLLIVHGIELVDGLPPKVSGGELLALCPWQLDDERLSAVCYEYRLN